MENLARRLKQAEASPDTSVPGRGQVGRWLLLIRQMRPLYRWSGVAALAVLGGGLAFVLAGGGTHASQRPGSPSTIVVTPRPLIERLSLVGTIFPGSVVNMVGPFPGAVKEKLVDYGMRVRRGQKLLVLDTTDIEIELREAEATEIKANREVESLNGWGNSPDVVRARNSVLSAQMKLDDSRRNQSESKGLFERGIIPKVEFEASTEQLKTEELQMTAAQQELDAVLDKGNAEHRHLVKLELETASKRLAELRRQMDAGIVLAPVDGLVLRPVTSSGGSGDTGPASIDVGSRVGAGQPIFTIANTDSLKVVARVDEVDVNRIEEGASVEVTGDAFGATPIVGQVARISSQAESGAGGANASKSASFEVVISIPVLSPDQRHQIRVGMSASLSIITYRNAAALVVPANTIQKGQTGTNFVTVRDGSPEHQHNVAVVVGKSTEDGVEILDGLKPGDVIVTQEIASTAVPAGPMAMQGAPGLPVMPLH